MSPDSDVIIQPTPESNVIMQAVPENGVIIQPTPELLVKVEAPTVQVITTGVTPGVPGPQGDTGESGPPGEPGIQGPIGPAGPTGEPGPEGPEGPQGATGAEGVQGSTGPTGPTGLKGDTGNTGAQGSQGLQGVKGDTGDIGPQGPQGIQGTQGIQGPTGTGEAGDQGPIGPQGDPGPTGPTGSIGPQGVQGPAGADGDDGATGPAGSTGPQGPAGAQGAQGPAGATGAQGPAGAAGATGAQGPAGSGFTWKGAWAAATAYAKDDVVSYQGESLIALVARPANADSSPGVTPTTVSVNSFPGGAGLVANPFILPAVTASIPSAAGPLSVFYFIDVTTTGTLGFDVGGAGGPVYAVLYDNLGNQLDSTFASWATTVRGVGRYILRIADFTGGYPKSSVVTKLGTAVIDQSNGPKWAYVARKGDAGAAGAAGATGPTGPAGSPYSRTSTPRSTASLADNAVETSALVLYPSFRLYKVDTNRAARIRIYATAAQRTADAGRSIGTDPVGNHGLLFELVTSSDILSYTLAPAVDFTADGSDSTYYMSVTNLSGATGVVTTTFYYVRTE